MSITKYRSIFIGIALGLSFISLALIGKYGIKPGIDFTGGTVIEIAINGEDAVLKNKSEIEGRGVKVFATGDIDGEKSYRLISTDNYDALKSELENYLTVGTSTYTVLGVSDVGPSLGGEMKQKAIIAIVVASLAILLFIAFSFRKVSEPVASWKYGIASLVTLLHDILIPTGAYALMSHYYGAEVDTLFIVALLTILGISVSDKIVVFDRIRENLTLSHKKSFSEIVDISLRQTFTRSVNTSLTVVLALLVLAVYGPAATVFFSITLTIGMIVGTYSSIFVASTLLTFFTKK